MLAIAAEVAADGALDLARFEDDWDSGRHKARVIADSRRGWHDLKVAGSPTFVLPGGRQVANPAAGRADIDKERGVVRSYTALYRRSAGRLLIAAGRCRAHGTMT